MVCLVLPMETLGYMADVKPARLTGFGVDMWTLDGDTITAVLKV